jgi:hypothetical protein
MRCACHVSCGTQSNDNCIRCSSEHGPLVDTCDEHGKEPSDSIK